MLGLAETSLLDRWKAAPRLSLASSALWADNQALAELRHRRQLAHWQAMAISLCQADSDIRPLLAHAPSVNALATTGRKLVTLAETQAARAHTEAASISYRASLFLGTAGLLIEAERARAAAFGCIRQAVEAGVAATRAFTSSRTWQASAVTVTAPARFDLGGGWSDTPPFCLDWGGTVLNFAVALHGRYPIRTTVRRIADPVIRCVAGEEGISAEFATTEEVFAPAAPGSPFSIPRLALQMLRVVTPDTELAATLRARGGGLEITTAVDLPMGSGLGTSSLLAATMLQALAHLCGITMNEADLSDQVMRLEQLMTTGGGWQDQAGGIFPGAKLVSSSPGLRQRLRVHPVHWSPEHREEFCSRMVLYYTGIRRIAKGLLDQVVSAYLARDTATVQVLHSIKTLAVEMSHALQEGEWDRLGALIDRHWQLNLLMDPHMTNAPINALLQDIRPFLAGAKPAGAGGGGFLLLLATSSHAARQLEERLAARSGNGAVFPWQLTDEGLHLEIEE
ncbi:MAG: D-glycero-alpha-D-manno-heptose 7-phosphate kinase [bacterium ADurb.Bin429]|nr:MAG: D-glycero-alpha-D-manno-heptose 7-phosphate kinase [bacterium ADurb.Bin429]